MNVTIRPLDRGALFSVMAGGWWWAEPLKEMVVGLGAHSLRALIKAKDRKEGHCGRGEGLQSPEQSEGGETGPEGR